LQRLKPGETAAGGDDTAAPVPAALVGEPDAASKFRRNDDFF